MFSLEPAAGRLAPRTRGDGAPRGIGVLELPPGEPLSGSIVRALSSTGMLDDCSLKHFCHLLPEDRSSSGFLPRVCLGARRCSVRSPDLAPDLRPTSPASWLTELLILSHKHTPSHFYLLESWRLQVSARLPKTLWSSLILSFLTSHPVFQEILLVLPSGFTSDLTASHPLRCCYSGHLSSGLFQQLPDHLLPSNLTPPRVCSYKDSG